MKKLCAIFLLFTAGCSAPSTTEINRPPADVNGVRRLLFETSFSPFEGETIASAAYSDSSSQGFGAGVFITCNSFTIIDTRQSTGVLDTQTQAFITPSTSYTWSYEGPDTSFEFTMNAPGNQFVITSPTSGEGIDPFIAGDSLDILYEPTGPCTNLMVKFIAFDASTDVEDTVKPTIQFDPLTGIITPIPLSPFTQLDFSGEGTVTIVKVSDSIFSIPSIHSITIKDSSSSEPSEIDWE